MKPLPPATWSMEPPSNSLEKLDQLFSISEKASSTTGQN
ncbi:lysis system o-spanin lipoprotein Rz1 [Xenorhabdus budapestensis]|nr:lysis system o-spanin lipoprotein Rz1 [Xenorhabdus budapestensis]